MEPDFEALLSGATVLTVDEPLMLPSGRLVAAEPPGLFPAGEVGIWAFGEIVPPGAYPVEIFLGRGVVVAARVVVRDETVREWTPARRRGHDYVYPVDGATGGFGSVEVFEELTGDDARDDLISDLSFGSDEPYTIYAGDDANLVAFRLGGDGRFLSWIGRTADGEVGCFLTDFAVL